MHKIAVIGGSRLYALKNLAITHSATVQTPYGAPSSPLNYGVLESGHEVVYLPRRGSDVPMPPHKINYRANIWALRDAGVKYILATAAVTGLNEHYPVGQLVIPDQLIDYTYGRDNTFFGDEQNISHISFTEPYSELLRQQLKREADTLGIKLWMEGTYGITQGPRLETRAEIQLLAKEGCDIVGMTGMPEAALARELNLEYACIALTTRAYQHIEMAEDEQRLGQQEQKAEQLVEQFIQNQT
jgi:5'-deoxy-5'-methylthioadenosine phosphorylase